MAGIALSITNVTVAAGGIVRVDFSNGEQIETSIANMLERRDALNANVVIAQDILLSKLITAQPSLDNPDALNGSTVSIDAAGASPIILTLNN